MSIRNPRTGRHEDDLYDHLMRNGSVPVSELIAHLNEIVVEDVSGQPTNVRTPVRLATLLLEALVSGGVIAPEAPISL